MTSKPGCTDYIATTVDIFFPADPGVCCKLCPLLETYSRMQCRRTGEYLASNQVVGYYCPLIIKNQEEEVFVDDDEDVFFTASD